MGLSLAAPKGAAISSFGTAHGTLYLYYGEAASLAVMSSLLRVQEALDEKQKDAARKIVQSLQGNAFIDPVTALGLAGLVVGGIGAVAGAVGAGASVLGAGASIAGMSRGPTGGSLQVTLHNDTLAPIVNYEVQQGGCSIASTCRPLLSGTTGTIDFVNTGGISEGACANMFFMAGGGTISASESDTLQTITPVPCAVQFQYINPSGGPSGSNWIPSLSIDSCEWMGAANGNGGNYGLTVLYFEPNADEAMLPLTIATYSTAQSSSEIDVLFLPGSAIPSQTT